jgi:hypothetical protein
MTLPGLLEWTSRALRFWYPSADGTWQPHVFQGYGPSLPLAVRYAGGWQVGWPAWKVYYSRPGEVLADWLADWQAARVYRIGRRKLTTPQLLPLFLAELGPVRMRLATWVALLPSYWQESQAQKFVEHLQRAGLPQVSALAQDLTLAWAISLRQGPFSSVLLADLDDHALVLSRAVRRGDALVIERRASFAELGRRVWIKSLLAACADVIVRHHRQDPRLSKEATQALFLDIERSLAQLRQADFRGQIHVADFHAEFLLPAPQIQQACARLAQTAAYLIRQFREPGDQLFLTWRFVELPGDTLRAVYRVLQHRQFVNVVDETDYLQAASNVVESAAALGSASWLYWQQITLLPGQMVHSPA